MFALGVDVSAEEAVAHIAGVTQVGLRVIALLRAQVCHAVSRGDEAGVGAQVEVEAFPESINPIVDPQARQVVVQTSPSPSVVQLVWERLSEVVHTHRGDDFV